jgi:tetratricopeptide (TPR) repeat protein
MKRIRIHIILLAASTRLFAVQDTLLPDTLIPAGNPEELFSEAGALYSNGAYEDALDLYRRIVSSGYEAADLYYDMGNAAFRSNNIGEAVLYYEKALKLDPNHEDAAHNLKFISRYVVDTFDEVPEFFLRTWVRSAIRALPEQAWSIIALSVFVLTLAALLLYLFSKRIGLKKTGFYSALMGFILLIFTLSAAISRHRAIVQPESGIIISPSVIVRSTPSETGTELFILHEGTKVIVNEDVTGWQNIRIIDGREGWIRTDDFEFI